MLPEPVSFSQCFFSEANFPCRRRSYLTHRTTHKRGVKLSWLGSWVCIAKVKHYEIWCHSFSSNNKQRGRRKLLVVAMRSNNAGWDKSLLTPVCPSLVSILMLRGGRLSERIETCLLLAWSQLNVYFFKQWISKNVLSDQIKCKVMYKLASAWCYILMRMQM